MGKEKSYFIFSRPHGSGVRLYSSCDDHPDSVMGVFRRIFLLQGFSEGNVTIAQAALEVAGKEEKIAKDFAKSVDFFTCTAFIVGPLLELACRSSQQSIFYIRNAFSLRSLMSLAAALIIWKFSTETKKHEDHGQGFFLRHEKRRE